MDVLAKYAGDISIVVSSCDRFFDAWRPFTFFFRKFWSDCPFATYLIVNELEVRSSTIRALRVGKDQGWASNMQLALEQIATPYILYFQEDYFLTAEVQRDQLASDISHAKQQNAASFCLCDLSLLEPEFGRRHERIGVVPDESKGRTRLQAALWKRDVFSSLLRPGESAWDMEARGNERTRGLRILSYARQDLVPFRYLMSGIVRGLWTQEAMELCRVHSFPLDRSFRSLDPGTKHARRFRRALDRVRFPIALARQRRQPVDLDTID